MIVHSAVSLTVASTIDGQVLMVTHPVDFQVMLNMEELTDANYVGLSPNLCRRLVDGGSRLGEVPILLKYAEMTHLFDVLLNT